MTDDPRRTPAPRRRVPSASAARAIDAPFVSTGAKGARSRVDSASFPTVVVRTPGKVNLHLGVHPGRDARGYHRADSVMVAVDVFDEVRVRTADDLRVAYAPAIDVAPERSVVWRAIAALAETLGVQPRASALVVRGIPSMSGLGSASADAAAALRACCALWNVSVNDRRVRAVARQIGADVAFFLDPAPSYLGGVGDELIETYPSPRLSLALVRPHAGVGTAEAYAEFDRHSSTPAPVDAMRAALSAGDAHAIATCLHNNLADAAMRVAPATREALAWTRQRQGVLAAQVTGSGSCVFAVCETDDFARAVARDARDDGWWAQAARSVGADALTTVMV